MKKIIDEFTNLPLAPHRKHLLRKQKKGICLKCFREATHNVYCLGHYTLSREHSKKSWNKYRESYNKKYNTKEYRDKLAERNKAKNEQHNRG